MKLRRLVAIPGTVLLVGATLAAANLGAVAPAAASTGQHAAINCEYSALCAEVANSSDVFGSEYVGHDEPSAVFYSNVPGSGNHMTYSLRLPRDPSPGQPEYAWQVLPVRAERRDLVRHGHVRHAVLPGAGVHLHARQRQQHRRPGGLAQPSGHRVRGAAVLPAGVDSLADLAGRGRSKRL